METSKPTRAKLNSKALIFIKDLDKYLTMPLTCKLVRSDRSVDYPELEKFIGSFVDTNDSDFAYKDPIYRYSVHDQWFRINLDGDMVPVSQWSVKFNGIEVGYKELIELETKISIIAKLNLMEKYLAECGIVKDVFGYMKKVVVGY